MKLKATDGLYFGNAVIIICDMQCHKAWGMNNRPHVYLDEPGQPVRGEGYADFYPDDDDLVDNGNTADLADSELGNAPMNPGTYEGADGKPITPEGRHNKWCVRECERSIMITPGEAFDVPDFSRRRHNIEPTYLDDTLAALAGE